jgi:hypothetical protein
MDQQSPPDVLPSVELPTPKPEVITPEQPQRLEQQAEKAGAQQIEQGISVPAPQPVQPVSQPVQAAQPPIVSPHDAPPSGVAGIAAMPQIADDADLIEKEWVDKAKQIVERTKHDPHQQTKEMNTMKADYLKKRYNKDLKLSE